MNAFMRFCLCDLEFLDMNDYRIIYQMFTKDIQSHTLHHLNVRHRTFFATSHVFENV
jgi:hypothetical protein